LIAETIYKSKEIEKWGSGLKRIYDECRANRVPVEFKVLKSGFLVIFRRNLKLAGGKSGEINEGVNEGVTLLIKYIQNNPGRRAPYIAKELNIPQKTLERWIKRLRTDKKIKYKGSAKTGGYYLVIPKTRW
jgi:ATP-dependent DNA helicase RecG